MYSLYVLFEMQPDRLEEFDARAAEVIEGVRHEPGALLYVNHQVEGSPNSRVFLEMYVDRAAFEEHCIQPHTVKFLEAKDRLVDSETVVFLPSLAGHVRG